MVKGEAWRTRVKANGRSAERTAFYSTDGGVVTPCMIRVRDVCPVGQESVPASASAGCASKNAAFLLRYVFCRGRTMQSGQRGLPGGVS